MVTMYNTNSYAVLSVNFTDLQMAPMATTPLATVFAASGVVAAFAGLHGAFCTRKAATVKAARASGFTVVPFTLTVNGKQVRAHVCVASALQGAICSAAHAAVQFFAFAQGASNVSCKRAAWLAEQLA